MKYCVRQSSFALETLHEDDIVVYLKNERTGSSTIRRCKFIGQIIDFTDIKVKIRRLSPPDKFVTPEECKDFGVDTIYPDDVMHIVISKYEEDSTTKLLRELNEIIDKRNKDINLLIGNWFSALEDEGADPWTIEECIEMANKYYYTEEDYRKYLKTIV